MVGRDRAIPADRSCSIIRYNDAVGFLHFLDFCYGQLEPLGEIWISHRSVSDFPFNSRSSRNCCAAKLSHLVFEGCES